MPNKCSLNEHYFFKYNDNTCVRTNTIKKYPTKTRTSLTNKLIYNQKIKWKMHINPA